MDVQVKVTETDLHVVVVISQFVINILFKSSIPEVYVFPARVNIFGFTRYQDHVNTLIKKINIESIS